MPGRRTAAARAGAVFVVPTGVPPSGGDLYNRCLADALSRAGFRCRTVGPEAMPVGRALPAELWVDGLFMGELEGRLAPARAGRDVFLIVHSLPSLDSALPARTARERRAAERRALDTASGFLVTSAYTRDVLRARGFRDRPIFVVPPATCVIAPDGPRPTTRFMGLVAGSLIPSKGILDYLAALRRLLRPPDDLTLRIAGRADIDPACASACLRTIETDPLLARAAVYLGPLPLERLRAEYAAANVFVSPSRTESYGMAFHDAMACGLPVLALRAPYSEPFIRHGRTGLLCPDAASLARATLSLARRPGRLAALARGADAARDERERRDYTWNDAALAFLDQYRAWSAGAGRAGHG